MKLDLVYVGRGPAWIEQGVEHYVKQLPMLNLIQLKKASPMGANFERILRQTSSQTFKVMLDATGTLLTSKKLASQLGHWQHSYPRIAFLLGPDQGFTNQQKSQVDFTWSLSRLTFPYALAKLLVVEQLFRAHSIIRQHPYHRA